MMRAARGVTSLEVGIFVISSAVILVELLLTRIFSVTMFNHLSFLVVSLAMLGFGASGLLITLFPERFPEQKLFTQTATAAALFAFSSVVAVKLSFRFPITLEASATNWQRISLVYGVSAVPFFFGGLVVSLILTHRADRANRMYFFDLAGASLGCLAFVPTTEWLGAPSAILFAASMGAVAGGVLSWRSAPWICRASLALAAGLLVACLENGRLHFLDVRFAKGARQLPTLALGWNSFSRVDVVGTPKSLWTAHMPMFAGFSGRLDPDFKIPEAKLQYDADASTQITYFDGDLRRLDYLAFDVSSSAYHLRKYHDVLVIGPGGGRDILTALSLGSGPVTGVEVNPLTVHLMRTRFRTFSGGLFDGFPGVTIVTDDGRSFMRHEKKKYELIEASLVDTWAASAAGAYALAENNLYTVEAFEEYFDRLTPDGVVCLNRWFADPPVEALRVVSIAREALSRRGIADPADHVLIVRTDPTDTLMPSAASLGSVMVKLSPFSQAEIDALTRYASDMGFVVPYTPGAQPSGQGAPSTSESRDFAAILGPDSADFISGYPFDVSPSFDDRPFFFNRAPIVPWLASRVGLSSSPLGSAPLGVGAETLLVSLVMTALGAALLLFLPYAAHRASPAASSPGSRRGVLWALYFASLGLGFIFVEMVLIQRFGLYLGHPVYSLAVVLFALLLASAVGSLLSGRPEWVHALPRSLACLVVLLLLYALALPPLLSATRGLSIAFRMAIAVVVIGPSGVLMGVPFASGVRRAGAESKRLVPWAWAANGGTSVFGSALAVLVSMTYGFTATLVGGAVAYGLARLALEPLVSPKIQSGLAGGEHGSREDGAAAPGSS